MINKTASLAISAILMAASSAQAGFVTEHPILTTLPNEMLPDPIASLSEAMPKPVADSLDHPNEQVAWTPFCDVIGAQGAEGGMGGYGWQNYGCN